MSLNLIYNQAGLELTTFASQELDKGMYSRALQKN